jgi:ribose 5-phosphate isomerase B
MKATIAFANDHAGVSLKQELLAAAEALGYATLNLGTNSDASVDYPDYGHALADAIAGGRAQLGVAICGSGVGISIAANRHANIRAALCANAEIAKLARQHNDANVLVLGARFITLDEALGCLQNFLATEFEAGRHAARVEKLG